jgi:KRAB domain-containing zinc finger protein
MDEIKCSTCDRKYKSEKSLRAHAKSHENPQFTCVVCAKEYHHRWMLDRHMGKHNVDRNLCPICGKTFATPSALTTHSHKTHTQTCTITCEECGEGFSNRDHLGGHQTAKHGKPKRFACGKCPSVFSYKKNLDYHVKHVCKTDRPPSCRSLKTCELCAKVFKDKRSLTQHLTVHKPPHISCHVCGFQFKWRSSYHAHAYICHK